MLLTYRILGDHVHYIFLSRCCCKCATTLQKQNLSPCPPISHFSLKLHWTSKFPTEISKTGPLRIFCIHLLRGLRVFTSTDMVQPSPQLNSVSVNITLSNFCSWKSNPSPLHKCMFTPCTNTVLQFLLYQENWFVAWLHYYLMELQVPGCGTQVAATPKCAILCALSSRSVVFLVLYCIMNFVAVG